MTRSCVCGLEYVLLERFLNGSCVPLQSMLGLGTSEHASKQGISADHRRSTVIGLLRVVQGQRGLKRKRQAVAGEEDENALKTRIKQTTSKHT